MSITLTKASLSFVILAIVLISNTEGSCWRYGHSCWGGHGKRSGGGSRVPIVDIRRISEHNSSPSDGSVAQFQELDNLQEQQQADVLGMDSSSREVTGRNELAYSPGRTYRLLENEVPVLKRAGDTEEEILPLAEMSDYDQPNEDSLVPVRAHSRKAGIDAEVALALDRPESYDSLRNSMESQEVFKRTMGDVPRRGSPKNKLLLYKLVRVVRKK